MSSTEKESSQFKFSVYQGNILFCERSFDAGSFNPYTRFSIDIRDTLPRCISKMQRVLSKKDEDIVMIKEALAYSNYKEYNPQPIVQQFIDSVTLEERTIKGVECKLGFYINDKPIVERIFLVDNFNPMVRWSRDLISTTTEVTNMIYNKIKSIDEKNMWDDNDLMNIKGLTQAQINDLTPQRREELLMKIRN
jgi:hypothetical protein